MQEIIIRYKNPKTLDALKDMSKYFDFIISVPVNKNKNKKETTFLNGVSITRERELTSSNKMKNVFTGKNIDAKDLRNKAWQRQK